MKNVNQVKYIFMTAFAKKKDKKTITIFRSEDVLKSGNYIVSCKSIQTLTGLKQKVHSISRRVFLTQTLQIIILGPFHSTIPTKSLQQYICPVAFIVNPVLRR